MKQKEKTSVSSLHTISKNPKVSNAQSANQQPVPDKICSVRETGQYKRSLRRCRKRGCSESNLSKVIDILAGSGQLPPKDLKHSLGGLYKGCWECHITDDCLLIWKEFDNGKEIILIDIGRHSELFDKQRR